MAIKGQPIYSFLTEQDQFHGEALPIVCLLLLTITLHHINKYGYIIIILSCQLNKFIATISFCKEKNKDEFAFDFSKTSSGSVTFSLRIRRAIDQIPKNRFLLEFPKDFLLSINLLWYNHFYKHTYLCSCVYIKINIFNI